MPRARFRLPSPEASSGWDGGPAAGARNSSTSSRAFPVSGLPARAARLLYRFGSVQAVICANSEALSAVDGIGRTTAQRIRSAVAEEVARYGVTEIISKVRQFAKTVGRVQQTSG